MEPVSEVLQIPRSRVELAIRKLKESVPPELRDDLSVFFEQMMDAINKGEEVDMRDVVAELMDPRKYGLSEQIIVEFLSTLISDESYIVGTIEMAKRKVYKKWQRPLLF